MTDEFSCKYKSNSQKSSLHQVQFSSGVFRLQIQEVHNVGLSSSQSAVHSPQSTVRSPQSTVHSPQSTIHNPQSTVCSLQSTIHNPQSSMHTQTQVNTHTDTEARQEVDTHTWLSLFCWGD